VLRLEVTSRVHIFSVDSVARSTDQPKAMSEAYIEPPEQPITMSTSICSRLKTFINPNAAAHLTLPEPITKAMRGVCF
jgi:hypothetical protein